MKCRYLVTGLLLVVLVDSVGCTLPKGSGPGSQSLALWLEVPSEVRTGETVPLKLAVKNISEHPVTIHHGRPAYDFIVTRSSGKGVWRWATAIEDILILTTLNPGEELEFAAEWDQRDFYGNRVPVGTYFVQGILMASEEPVREPRTKPERLIILP